MISLARWIDMNRLGWYSADLHNHRLPDDMPQLLLAEDLNLTPVITEWIWEDRPKSLAPRNLRGGHSASRCDTCLQRVR
jgi:hypothetical protein